jgi:beta-glucosidase
VTLPLAPEDLTYWNDAAKAWTLEADKVQVMVGGSSDKLPLSATVQVVK